MRPSTAIRLALGASSLAALSACYVVPIDPRTGQPLPTGQAPQVTIVQPTLPAAVAGPAAPALLQARLYPLNEIAHSAGFVVASVTDQHSGRGSISLNYRGQWMQGEATRVGAGFSGFGRIHSLVLGGEVSDLGGGRRGIANAVGGNGISAQCEYQLTVASNGTGACLFSDGAKYQMHFGQ